MFNDFLRIESILPKVKFFDISDVLMKIRMVKDEIEIENIRRACDIADIVMDKIPEFLFEGISENELAAEIDYLMQKNGASKPAFGTISSFGRNTSEPHYSHGDVKLRYGDFVLCDFGACFKRYNSDMTRTFIFGESDNKQRKIYDIVFEAQKVAFDFIKSGVKAKEVHNLVFNFIEKSDFKGRFIHSTGHSLGLNVHDGNVGFNSICDEELKDNMVFTVEPGVYIPEFGGVRIEDDILVKKEGIEILTKSKRDLIEIK
jgi:Xaa-Pro dipeptidase